MQMSYKCRISSKESTTLYTNEHRAIWVWNGWPFWAAIHHRMLFLFSRLCAWLFRKGCISKCIQALPVNSCLCADKADCNAAANIVLWQLLWVFLKFFSQSFPLKCPINKYEIITVFVEDSRLFLFVQSCWQSETPWDVHPSCMSNVADMMGCWRVVNILHRENQEEVNITSITNPHLELCFCNNICAIRPNPTFCLSWNEVSVKMIMRLSPGFLWQPLFAS